MKKMVSLWMCLLLMLSLCVPVWAADFAPFKLEVSRVGQASGNLRLVVKASCLPRAFGEGELTGGRVTGQITDVNERVYPVDSVVVSNTAVASSEIKIDITMVEGLDVDNQKNLKFVYDMTLSPGAETGFDLPEGQTTFFVPYTAFEMDLGPTWYVESAFNLRSSVGGENAKDEPATAVIQTPEDGTYYIWAFSKDFDDATKREYQVVVNGTTLENAVGKHGEGEKWAWQLAGSMELSAGRTEIGLRALDQFARCRMLLFTTDPQWTPPSSDESILYAMNNYCIQPVNDVDMAGVSAVGDTVTFRLTNRTAQDFAGGLVVGAIYQEGKLVETKTMPAESLASKKRSETYSMSFDAFSPWDTGKLFLWNSVSGMQPLAAAKDFTYLPPDLANPDEEEDFGKGDFMLDYQNDKEFSMRDGLANVLSKLEAGEDVTVGYVGASITHANAWRQPFTQWLKSTYPDASIRELTLTAPGTNSDLGACRIDANLLNENPDLVIVEYAVDNGQGEWMEGIIRQIWEKDPTIDIYMIHAVHTTWYPTYEAGGVSEPAATYEKLADYYGIPSVNFNYQIFDLYNQGKLTLKATEPEGDKILFSEDGIHPTSDGGRLYAGAAARGILKMQQQSLEPAAHQLPEEALYSSEWAGARSYDFSMAKFEGDWFDCVADSESTGYGSNFPYTGQYLSLIKSSFPVMKGTKTPGASVTIRFEGTQLGIYEAGGQFSGRYHIEIDGKDAGYIDSINRNCTKLRHQYFFIPEQPYGEHTVTITLDETWPAVKTELKKKYPSDDVYDRLEAYFGEILVVGTLLDANEA